MKKVFLLLLLFLTVGSASFGQRFLEHSNEFNKGRVLGTSITGTTLWAGSIVGLQYVWYSDFEKSKFHLFDDSRQWNQMDKLGHAYTAYILTDFVSSLYKWSGVNHKTSAIIGAAYSFGYLASFEFLDAYNEEWGFSFSDIGFNAIGSATYFVQDYCFDEQFVRLKFSASKSGLAQYRPNVLGNDFASRLLKDYNGQTYWASFNPFTWGKQDTKIPKWINLAIGYGTQNQLIGDGGTYSVINGNEQLNFTPYRQFYLSLDVDFEKIPVESRFLKLLFKGMNYIKIPFPALEFSEGQFKFRPLYF